MNDDRSGAHGPADEQRTTRIPRPPRRGRPYPPARDEYDDEQETTVLRRPGPPAAPRGPAGTPAPRASALPPYSPPPEAYPPPTAPLRDDRGRRDDDQWPRDDDQYDYGERPASRQGRGGRSTEDDGPADVYDPRGLTHKPRKLTVTRVAALRSRELTHRGLVKFHGAVSADGADLSGLAHLTYAQMGNYAVDAALAVALANTLFFAAATAESTGKVLLYLLLTVAPFAVVAPFIGPLLDKLQHGRRIALAASSFGRAALALTMALKFESWVIYPCALGMLVLSKSFGVLKAALTPRVLPDAITLVKTNSRLSVFGLIAGGLAGAIAAGIAAIFGSAGALAFTAACGIVGGWLCLRIPAWVESTEGEVPVHHSQQLPRRAPATSRSGLTTVVRGAMWINATIRIETGFLALFIAFVVKTEYEPSSAVAASGATATPADGGGWTQLLLLGAVGAAAGLGGFIGNALGARLPLRAPETVALACLCCVIVTVVAAFLMPGIVAACAVGLVGSTGSALAKVCLDSSIQQDLPEASRASAFGRSESVLQLSWVFGGVIGLLIGGVWGLSGDTVYMVGFGVVALLLIAGAAQCVAIRMERTLLPQLRGRRPRRGPRATDGTRPPRGTARPPQPAGTTAPQQTLAQPRARRTRKVNGRRR